MLFQWPIFEWRAKEVLGFLDTARRAPAARGQNDILTRVKVRQQAHSVAIVRSG